MTVYWILWGISGFAVILFFLLFGPTYWMQYLIKAIHPADDCRLLSTSFQGADSDTYEPSMPGRRYLKQYQICRSKGKERKFFIGEWEKSIGSVVYDLACYDENGKIIEIIHVCEGVNQKRFTVETELPPETESISFCLQQIDGAYADTACSRKKIIGRMVPIVFAAFMIAEVVLWAVFLISETAGKTVLVDAADAVWLIVLPGSTILLLFAIAFLLLSFCRSRYIKSYHQKTDRNRKNKVGVFRRIKYGWQKIVCFFYNIGQSVAWCPMWRWIHFRTRNETLDKKNKMPNKQNKGTKKENQTAKPLIKKEFSQNFFVSVRQYLFWKGQKTNKLAIRLQNNTKIVVTGVRLRVGYTVGKASGAEEIAIDGLMGLPDSEFILPDILLPREWSLDEIKVERVISKEYSYRLSADEKSVIMEKRNQANELSNPYSCKKQSNQTLRFKKGISKVFIFLTVFLFLLSFAFAFSHMLIHDEETEACTYEYVLGDNDVDIG